MTRVSSTEAARQFSELLNRVRYKHESFIITRNGEDLGCLAPLPGRITFKELFARVGSAQTDSQFAEDLESIQRDQQLPEERWEF